MSYDTATALKPKTYRPFAFVLPGILFLCAAGLLVYDRTHVHTTIAPMPKPYTYQVQQTVANNVHYRQSSFFNNAPSAYNTAYLADLTDYITAHFHYSFKGSEATKLTYKYAAKATVRATSGSQDSEGGLASVWTKQFDLIKTKQGSQTGKTLTLDPEVRIPFADYKKEMDAFKTVFNAPLNGVMLVTYNIQVSGKINGTPFSNNKQATITTSFDQQVYQLETKYIKTDSHDVFPAQSRQLADTITEYELLMIIVLAAAGIGCISYGFRRQIFKTPYMRQLERIYRYHDGIIIRARKQPNLANKNIVPVQSFDDLLNLEEEVKAPIVAAEAGNNATQFMITKDDAVYIYTLGELSPGSTPPASVAAQDSGQKRPEKKIRVSG
jgi:hypothetical protein